MHIIITLNDMAVTHSLGKEHNHALYTTKPNTGKGVAQVPMLQLRVQMSCYIYKIAILMKHFSSQACHS